MASVIEIRGLRKYFGEVKAVDGIDFDVEEGSLFAFLGLNGAGKSTTINILCSILRKDAGEVRVAGYDIDRDAEKIKREIGIVFQNSVLDRALSVKDNLTVRASYYGLSGARWKARLDELTGLLSLGDFLGRPYGKLSGGQRRRVDVARGLLNDPRILILDEPTTGLDPQSRRAVWSVIDRLRRESGMTVFLTTHYMEESNRADRVVILDAGKVAAEGMPAALKNAYSSDYIKIYRPREQRTDAALADCDFSYEDNCYKVKIADGRAAKAFLARYGEIAEDFEVVKGDMDDVFLNVTGKRLGGGEQA